MAGAAGVSGGRRADGAAGLDVVGGGRFLRPAVPQPAGHPFGGQLRTAGDRAGAEFAAGLRPGAVPGGARSLRRGPGGAMASAGRGGGRDFPLGLLALLSAGGLAALGARLWLPLAAGDPLASTLRLVPLLLASLYGLPRCGGGGGARRLWL